MNRNIFYNGLMAIAASFLFFKGNAQITISGQSCVVPGTMYQYIISGASMSSIQVCVTAGSIPDSAGGPVSCKTLDSSARAVLVIWNDSASDEGSLNLSSSAGNFLLNVQFSPELKPGAIDSASKVQFIDSNAIPAKISCGLDSGGACTPKYEYQWQQSSDMVSWSDIPDANGQELVISQGLTQSSYYRRKVTETISRTIGYSDAAAVFVMLQMGSQ